MARKKKRKAGGKRKARRTTKKRPSTKRKATKAKRKAPKRKAKAGRKTARKARKAPRKTARKASRRRTRKNPPAKALRVHFKPGNRYVSKKKIKNKLIKHGFASLGANRETYVNPFYSALRRRRNPNMFEGQTSYTATFKKNQANRRAVKNHIARGGWGKIVRRGRRAGQLRLNPGGGRVVGILKTAAGFGTGALLATKVVPTLVGRFMPAAANGLVGNVVGVVGAVAAGKLLSKALNSPALRNQVYLGALTTLGVSLVGMIIRRLPSSVTSRVGLSGMGDITPVSALIQGEALYSPSMGDYLQLSGPVPADLFAGGLNGVGDYVDFTSRAAGRAAATISAQQTEWAPSWSPANETF